MDDLGSPREEKLNWDQDARGSDKCESVEGLFMKDDDFRSITERKEARVKFFYFNWRNKDERKKLLYNFIFLKKRRRQTDKTQRKCELQCKCSIIYIVGDLRPQRKLKTKVKSFVYQYGLCQFIF